MTVAPLEIPGPRKSPFDRFRYPLFVVLELLAFFAIWQAAVEVFMIASPVFLPPPTKILGTLVAMFADGTMGEAIRTSAFHWLGGYTVGATVGITVGLLMGAAKPIRRLISPLAWAFYSVPYIWILPMLVIWFRFGAVPVMSLVFYASVLPIMLTTAAGAATVNEEVIRAARVFGIKGVALRRKVTIPATLPFITTGMRLAVPTSLIAVIIGEFLSGSAGLGRVLAISAARIKIDEVFATIIVLVAVSTSMIVAFGFLERRFAPWRTDDWGAE
jgi:NitT/TauT family transport system permease protein